MCSSYAALCRRWRLECTPLFITQTQHQPTGGLQMGGHQQSEILRAGGWAVEYCVATHPHFQICTSGHGS